ncbi:MAG: antitoxin [Magnetococcales bacterium]|nr:antitoxin [Magnetococcales bacterium]
MSTPEQIKRNLFAVENAIVQQHLEGLEVPPDVIEDRMRSVRGEITMQDGSRNTLRKSGHEQIRGNRPLS